MAALTLEIVTPERRVATLQADEVRAPGVLGGFGIRKDHTPFMSQLAARAAHRRRRARARCTTPSAAASSRWPTTR